MASSPVPVVTWPEVAEEVRELDSDTADRLDELDAAKLCPACRVVTLPYGTKIFEDGHLYSPNLTNVSSNFIGIVLDGCCERSQEREYSHHWRSQGEVRQHRVLDSHQLYSPGDLVGLEAATAALTSTPFTSIFEVITAGSTSAQLLWNWEWHASAAKTQSRLHSHFSKTRTGLKGQTFDEAFWLDFTNYRIDELCNFLGLSDSWSARVLLLDISGLSNPSDASQFRFRDFLLCKALRATESYKLLATDIYPQIDPDNSNAKLAYGIWQAALRLQLIHGGAMPAYTVVGDLRPSRCGPFSQLREFMETVVNRGKDQAVVVLEPTEAIGDSILPFFDFNALRNLKDPAEFDAKLSDFVRNQSEASVFRNIQFIRRSQLHDDAKLREALFHTKRPIADRHDFFSGFLRIGK